jgi:hypothetical protein
MRRILMMVMAVVQAFGMFIDEFLAMNEYPLFVID